MTSIKERERELPLFEEIEIEMETTQSVKHPSAENHSVDKKSKPRKCWDWFSTFFIKNYLPISLIFAVVFGAFIPAPGVFFNHKETTYVCIAVLFLYVGLYLKTSAMKDGIKAYKAYIWSITSILLVTCVIGGQLTDLLNFDEWKGSTNTGNRNVSNNTESTSIPIDRGDTLGPFECKVGLILYLIMPCTVGSGAIMVNYMYIYSLKTFIKVGYAMGAFAILGLDSRLSLETSAINLHEIYVTVHHIVL